jgi:hypothetical protein
MFRLRFELAHSAGTPTSLPVTGSIEMETYF